MRLPNLGELELELLQFITDHSPITVRELTNQFGKPRELARTTILTVVERLRKKGYVERSNNNGVFEYSPCIPKNDLMRGIMHSFTDKVLKGSIDPLVAYLVEDAELNNEQIKQLQHLIESFEEKKRQKSDE